MRDILEEFLRKVGNKLQKILLSNIKKKEKKVKTKIYKIYGNNRLIHEHSRIHTAFLNA